MPRKKQPAKGHFDWAQLVEAWIVELTSLRDYIRDKGHHCKRSRNTSVRQMTKVIALLKAVAEDDYVVTARTPLEQAKKEERARQRDLNRALKIIREKLFEWWD